MSSGGGIEVTNTHWVRDDMKKLTTGPLGWVQDSHDMVESQHCSVTSFTESFNSETFNGSTQTVNAGVNLSISTSQCLGFVVRIDCVNHAFNYTLERTQ